ncbi:lactoylglutathione lyase [Mucilaginibacter pineti]|uniref:Lactoylglutathione lyase n=1 Tax=Mucilaginibacter pineti TaxID=1391627 RepID=A0A1G7KUA4_9SPHI|nr:VOC family protein [Mucilaginibacter pineti]SDF40676.1 lactoylglutathione lyase [Mucilaginibacter pineti]
MSLSFNTAHAAPGKFKLMLFTLICLLPAFSYAQSASDASPVVDHISICVRDLKKSVAFYTEVMHLQKVKNPFNDTVSHQWYNLGNHIKLHAIQGDCNSSHPKNEHLCFAVGSVTTFAKTLDKMNIPYGNWNGDSKTPTHRADGVLQLYFQDPDGYWIEINSPDKK